MKCLFIVGAFYKLKLHGSFYDGQYVQVFTDSSADGLLPVRTLDGVDTRVHFDELDPLSKLDTIEQVRAVTQAQDGHPSPADAKAVADAALYGYRATAPVDEMSDRLAAALTDANRKMLSEQAPCNAPSTPEATISKLTDALTEQISTTMGLLDKYLDAHRRIVELQESNRSAHANIHQLQIDLDKVNEQADKWHRELTEANEQVFRHSADYKALDSANAQQAMRIAELERVDEDRADAFRQRGEALMNTARELEIAQADVKTLQQMNANQTTFIDNLRKDLAGRNQVILDLQGSCSAALFSRNTLRALVEDLIGVIEAVPRTCSPHPADDLAYHEAKDYVASLEQA